MTQAQQYQLGQVRTRRKFKAKAFLHGVVEHAVIWEKGCDVLWKKYDSCDRIRAEGVRSDMSRRVYKH